MAKNCCPLIHNTIQTFPNDLQLIYFILFSSHYYGVEVPDQERKHLHQTKYVIIHEYDDKDEDPANNYYHLSNPKSYSELKYYGGGDAGNHDGNKYEYDHDDHDHYHHSYHSADADKDGLGHSYGHSYSSGYKHSTKDGDKKVTPGPNAYTTKDKDRKNKVEFNIYHDYSVPSFDEYGPKSSYQSGYDIESHKTTGTPFNSVSVIPTTASFKSFSPTSTTLKSFTPTKFPTYVQTTGYYANNYKVQPSSLPYTHDTDPLKDDFKEYEKSKLKTEDYIYSNSPSYEHKSYDDVKKGVETFNDELSRLMDKKIEEDDYTLQKFRREDALDEIEHAKFVSDIEYDHGKF